MDSFSLKTVFTVLTVALGFAILRWILALQQAFTTIRTIPGRKIQWLDPFRTFALVLGPVYPKAGTVGAYYGKFSLYETFGSTIISAVRPFSGRLYFWIADADALKIVFGDRHTFQKDVEAYEPIEIYGKNLIGAEGSEWKRHKAIASPAFSEANNALVWTETIHVLHEWFQEIDEQLGNNFNTTPNEVTMSIVPSMTQLTLLVITAAGFGGRVSWKEDTAQEVPAGHTLPFSQAVRRTVRNLFFKVLTPNWLCTVASVVPIPGLSRKLNETTEAFDELKSYMLEIVSAARDSVVAGKGAGDAALLRSLVEANMNQEGDVKRLTDEELLSDIFVFLLAGHETSAHSLSFAIVMMALYPDVQRRVLEEASKVWPGDADVTELKSSYKDDFPEFEYTLATFRETLRLFPAEPRLAKHVAADAVVTATRFTQHKDGHNLHGDEEKIPVAMPKGSVVITDILGVHRNPLHWGADCKEFKPERFIDTDTYRWPRHAFLAFSAGARGCIGSRFSLTESVCTLACLVRRYEILPPPNVAKMGAEERMHWLTKWTTGITITPVNALVTFRRRGIS
ncbi:cytochrome P450 [Artomyces pyxidatus]|uniref:Cytochrome P450 n=1 Tax=Artomyces pyxidatus TaxID=48021 RepID=A0ACB8TEZ6_9AGAM|nr:cytochrome P450 [Artomyces pyxidatus]